MKNKNYFGLISNLFDLSQIIPISILAFSASIFEEKHRVLVNTKVRNLHGPIELDHLGALDIGIDVPEHVESFWLSLGLREEFNVDGKRLRDQMA